MFIWCFVFLREEWGNAGGFRFWSCALQGTIILSPHYQQMEKKKQENKMRRDQLNDEYLELLEKQRLYFKTVKEFKEVNGTLVVVGREREKTRTQRYFVSKALTMTSHLPHPPIT